MHDTNISIYIYIYIFTMSAEPVVVGLNLLSNCIIIHSKMDLNYLHPMVAITKRSAYQTMKAKENRYTKTKIVYTELSVCQYCKMENVVP